jgi:tRNA modification GTPase
LAEPGEFTRRAVENGRLDLTQAEALADLINAETEAQRCQALRQFEGELGRMYEDWRARIIRAAAWIEASIDFPDEDVPDTTLSESKSQIAELLQEIESHVADGRRGEILRDGVHVAVIGPPNVGKSSLVNALARRDVAIVSEVAGTTRDVIEVRLDLAGYPVVLADTAGLREAKDAIEAEGVRRAEARARAADITLLVLDASAPKGIEASIQNKADIIVWNKCDIASIARSGLMISAKSGEGLHELISRLAGKAKELAGAREAPALTRARHRNELESAIASLRAALQNFSHCDLAAEDMRCALQAIGRITGRVDLEELLDSVFRDFCIGK